MDKKRGEALPWSIEPRLRNDVSGFALIRQVRTQEPFYKTLKLKNLTGCDAALVNANVAGAGFDADCGAAAVELASNMMTIG